MRLTLDQKQSMGLQIIDYYLCRGQATDFQQYLGEDVYAMPANYR